MSKQIFRGFLTVLMGIFLLCGLTACGHEHSFGAWRTVEKASCEQAGSKERKCECGEKEVKKLPKKEHSYQEEVTAEAGCTGEGKITYTCSECKDTYTEAVEAKVYTSTEIHDLYLNSVGEIVVYDQKGEEYGLGSCFVYTQDGQLITNYHVIDGAYSAKVTIDDETYKVQKVLAYDKDIDIAILEISETGLTPVKLCDKDHDVGATVYAFGNSRGLTSTFSDGMITYSNREVEGVAHVQHDAPISGGNSGGPLINEYGEVIGVNTWTVVDSQNLNFAIHISELDNLSNEEALTMAEFYEKECSPYKKIVKYVTTEATKNDGMYLLELYAQTTQSGSRYSIDALYTESDGEIWLIMGIDAECYTYIIIEEDTDGVYEWTYFDDYDNDMNGIVNAAAFDGNKMLSYTYSNEYGDDRDMTLELATLMLDYLCTYMDEALEDAGVTAQDLGFSKY